MSNGALPVLAVWYRGLLDWGLLKAARLETQFRLDAQ